MLSMPPATTYLKSPQRRSLAAIIAARIPEPQTLLRVIAPVPTGQPAPRAAAGGARAGRSLPLAGGEDAAHVDLLDLAGRQTRALDGGGDRARPQGVRG